MRNIVELKARPRATSAVGSVTEHSVAGADLSALQDLQALCAKAVASGGLDAGGPTALDFIVAVHRALKGREWKVRFYRGDASGL